MNSVEEQYLNILEKILKKGRKKRDRTGTGSLSLFGTEIRHSMNDGFPLLTTKKISLKNVSTELFWFLSGDTNIKNLLSNKNKIWVGDAFKKYLKNTPVNEFQSQEEFINKLLVNDEFCEKWGEMGRIYPYQWRKFTSFVNDKVIITDQIKNILNDLIVDPDSRRLIVNAWNPGELNEMILPPCHFGFQCYTHEADDDEVLDYLTKNDIDFDFDGSNFISKNNTPIPDRVLSLKWHQRSADFPLGVPYNIASYGLLLMLFALESNMIPGELIGTFGDSHIYLDQIDGVKTQLERTPFNLPEVEINKKVVNDISDYTHDDINLINYVSHPSIYFPLSN